MLLWLPLYCFQICDVGYYFTNNIYGGQCVVETGLTTKTIGSNIFVVSLDQHIKVDLELCSSICIASGDMLDLIMELPLTHW